MRQSHLTPPPVTATERRVLMSRACGALRAEARTIAQLVEAVKRLQIAVGTDDLPGIDDALFGYRRISFTLREARTLRRSLMTTLTQPAATDLDGAAAALDRDDEFRTAMSRLQASSQELATHLASCRRVLRDAFADALRDIPDLTNEADDTDRDWTPQVGGQR